MYISLYPAGVGARLPHLRMLNISANYLVDLSGQALEGLDSLETLDMSDNEIVLAGNESQFFTFVPNLRRYVNLLIRGYCS